MLYRQIFILFFVFCSKMCLYSQTLYLLPLKAPNHIKDSIVQIIVERKQNDNWKENITWHNVYSYNKKHDLRKAEIYGQTYSIKYKKGRVKSVVIRNERKKIGKLIYHYNEKNQVFKISSYDYTKYFKRFQGNEYIEYDDLNRVTGSSFIVENNSLHSGYSHSAHYEYDRSTRRLISEDWGYRKIKHQYNSEGQIKYSLILDNEFGKRESRRKYQISIVDQ